MIGDGSVPAGTLPALLPAGLAPEVRPLLEILPAQLLAAELAVSRGHDPDSPRGTEEGDPHAVSAPLPTVASAPAATGPGS